MQQENRVREVLEGIADLRQRLVKIWEKAVNEQDSDTSDERLKRWKERAVRYLKDNVSDKEAKNLDDTYLGSFIAGDFLGNLSDEITLYDGVLKALVEEIEDDPSAIRQNTPPPVIEPDQSISKEALARSPRSHPSKHSVFIGHGRNPLWARLQIFLERDLGLHTINYESESRVGDSIIPILETMLDQATFAVLILTGEDETSVGDKRARQNVIHEAGLFQGRLGFKKAVLLKQEGLEDFTNVAGLQYISFSGDRIEQAFYELQRTLKREKIIP